MIDVFAHELSSGDMRATVSQTGAYLESLSVQSIGNLLLPRQIVIENEKPKDRGGMFLCAPFFGPGEDLGLNQHGFARDPKLPWEVIKKTSDSIQLGLLIDPYKMTARGIDQYAGLDLVYSNRIADNTKSGGSYLLESKLVLTNYGNRKMIVAPALHPFFPMKEGESASDIAITFGDEDEEIRKFNEGQLLRAPVSDDVRVVRFEFGDWQVTMRNRKLGRTAIWSGDPMLYLCAEPTNDGAVFDDKATVAKLLEHEIDHGKVVKYSNSIEWRPRLAA